MLKSNEFNRPNDKSKIENKITEYIQLIEKEYGIYISSDTINYLRNNTNELVDFNKEKSLSFFVSNGKLLLPSFAYELFPVLMEQPNYKSNPNNRVQEKDYLNTNTTYYDYINHVIEAGLTPYDYFEESLLHETMHLCGSGGGTPLEEGINELKTRELAQKYHIKIAAIGYSKEVEIAKEIQEIIGKDTMSEISFLNPLRTINLIEKEAGIEVAKLYKNIRNLMIEQSNDYMQQLQKISNPIEKAKVYSEIDYSKIHRLIDAYKVNNSNYKK